MAKKRRKRKKIINYRKFTTLMQRKLVVAFAFVALCLVGLSAVLISINYTKGKTYAKSVLENQSYQTKTIPYVRGQILDRNGTVLAYSPKVYNLIVDAHLMNAGGEKSIDATVKALEKCFDVDGDALREYVQNNTNSRYYRILLKLKRSEIEEFQELMNDAKNNPYIAGVWFEEDYDRVYPFGTLASDTIGFTVNGGTGELGLEKYYNDILSGTNGYVIGYVNEGLEVVTKQKEAVDGNNIVTTIDYFIQSVAEKYVAEYNEEYGSKATGVIVQNPNTGEIYAMVDYPEFDLNNPRDLSGFFTEEELAAMSDEDMLNAMYDVWRNFCVSDIYEPGSVIKPFTVASGLDEGTLKGDETFMCDGYETVGGHNVHCDRTWGHGLLTLEQSIMFSCNDSLMQIAALEGAAQLSKYQCIFGFGQKTGIDLPGEELGLLIEEKNMTDVDLYTNSFGQNMNTTMIQVSTAFCSLINGGNYYKPYLLKSVFNSDGSLITETQPDLLRKTVSKETSDTLRQYLYDTVEAGTATLAKVNGYEVGGKTGTAEKYPREDEKYLLSFIGFAPLDNPQVVVYVVVDEPNEENSSHSPSAKTISSKIMSEILPYLNVETK